MTPVRQKIKSFGTTDIAAGAGATIQIVGGDSQNYRQNMMFHPNAFALVMVPMVKPAGAVDVARKSYKGTSVRVVSYHHQRRQQLSPPCPLWRQGAG